MVSYGMPNALAIITMQKLTIINRPSFKSQNRYILAFGSYGHTVLMAFADNLEDAVDECIDWCAENAPGLLCTDYVNEDEPSKKALKGLDCLTVRILSYQVELP